MNVLTGRPSLKLRRASRHAWGEDPTRVVMVTLIEHGEGVVAQVWGAEAGQAVELERREGAEIRKERGPITVDFADGTAWVLEQVGCSCKVPPALKGFNPLRSR